MSTRFIDITACTIGTTAVTTVDEITYRVETKEIADSGDADKSDTYLARGKSTVRGTIRLKDPVQANALLSAAAGNFIFKGSDGSATPVHCTVTVAGCQFFNQDSSGQHDDLWKNTVSFRGFGVTPLTVAAA